MSVVKTDRSDHAREAYADARRKYQRVLGAWAMDCLRLRHQGLNRPCQREGSLSGIAWGARTDRQAA